MARQIRWYIPFVSRSGVACTIRIFDETYTGLPIVLSTSNPSAPGVPCEDPFYYEEDNSENLTQNIRYRTGYIQLVETSYGGLADIYPQTSTDRYVQFWYGSRLDFSGYIKAQAYSNEFGPAPRVVKFPVISPLGLLGGLYFAAVNPPGPVSLGKALKEVVSGLNAEYAKVVYPQTTLSASNLTDEFLSLLISPFNSEFPKYNGTDSDVFSPLTYEWFVDNLCNMMGWIVHDTPESVIFQSILWSREYRESDIEDLDAASDIPYTDVTEVTGDTSVNIDDYYSFRDDEAEESLVKPFGRIIKSFQGQSTNSVAFPWERMSLFRYSSQQPAIEEISGYKVAQLYPRGPELSGLVIPGYISNNKTQYGASVMVVGNASQKKQMLCFTCPSGGYSEGYTFFTWTLYDYPNTHFSLHINMESGGSSVFSLSSLDHEVRFRVELQNATHGGYGNSMTVGSSGGRSFIYPSFRRRPITITFKAEADNGFVPGNIYNISSLTIERNKDAFLEYISDETSESVIDGNNASDEDADIQMGLQYERDFDTMVGELDADEGTPPGNLADYRYLLRAQTRIVATFVSRNLTEPSAPTLDPSLIYIPRWQYWKSGWNWRVIARSFHPWDDEERITIHRTPLL